MRRALLACLTLILIPSSPAWAQPRFPLVIQQVRVGFPGGFEMDGEPVSLFKAGAWAPVYIDIKAEKPGFKGTEGPVEVTVTSPDPDDVSTNYTVTATLPPLAPDQVATVMAYTKIAGFSPEVSVTLRGAGNTIGQTYKKTFNGLEASQSLYLTLGARLPGLRESVRGQNPRNDSLPENASYIDRVDQLPTHWFAYQGVDVIFLCTSNRDSFLLPFANPNEKRYRQALIDWVERGGHLVVCAGRNQSDLAVIPDFQRLLPVTFTKREEVGVLELRWPGGEGGRLGPIEVTRFTAKPDRMVHTLFAQGEGGPPLIVQSPFGLGRVTVLPFDPEVKPFSDWLGQFQRKDEPSFWLGFFTASGVRPQVDPEARTDYYQTNELLSRLQNYLENFDDVPVIPFGWVFLFIIIYIIIVGPLDYWFLKKVVKRLELTWITFPTVVLVVSALAYFTAYQVKGKDLRIRKVDLVDVDLRSKQTVGHTWFTLFSPRIQHYTLGIEPSAPLWAPKIVDETKEPPVVVSWMNRPDTDRRYGGGPRARRQSLFRRSYDYETDAIGLKGVPIQVWATKSFTASWQAPLPAEQPFLTANVHRDAKAPLGIGGEITWWSAGGKADMALKDAVIIRDGKVYDFPLVAGTPKNVNTLQQRFGGGNEVKTWLQPMRDTTSNNSAYGRSVPRLDDTLRQAFFHRALEAGQQNASLRFLDQTWRMQQDQHDEVILVGRLEPLRGSAEDVTKAAVSACRLWLGAIPEGDKERPELVGLMLQETYVRVFIPIQPVPGAPVSLFADP